MKLKDINIVLLFILCLAGNINTIKGQDLGKIGKDDIFKYNGGLQVSSMAYGTQGMENRRDPFFYIINANLNFTLFEVINIPLSAYYSKNNYDYTKPTFNHFGISPSYKFLTVHAGYRSMQLSSYSLSGLTFLGGGVEVNPKDLPIKFSAMYGKFAKAVPYKEEYENFNSNNRFDRPGYRRMGYGGKLTIGKKEQSVELIFFKAKDDPNSIPDPDPESGITPKENLVIGFHTKNKITDRISLQTEYSLSALNQDVRLPQRDMETFTYVNNLGGLFTPRYSTSVSGIFSGSLSYSAQSVSFGVNYKRVPPGYKSLGTTYLSNDIENIHLNLQKSFFDNKITLSGNIGTEHNNLDKSQKSTNRRIIGSANCNINLFNPLNINLNYSNFNSNTAPVHTTFRDTFKYVQVTENYGANLSYQISKNKLAHNFNVNTNYQNVNTLNKTATKVDNRNTKTLNSIFSYNLNLEPLQINLLSSFHFNYFMPAGQGKNVAIGPTIGGSRAFLEGKLRARFNYSFQINSASEDQKNKAHIVRINSSYNISTHHNLQFSLSMRTQELKETEQKEGTINKEYKARLTYSFNF